MTKFELANHLANLLDIDSYLDDIGTPTPAWLNWEEKRCLDEMDKLVTKEMEDARKSEQERASKSETGTYSQSR